MSLITTQTLAVQFAQMISMQGLVRHAHCSIKQVPCLVTLPLGFGYGREGRRQRVLAHGRCLGRSQRRSGLRPCLSLSLQILKEAQIMSAGHLTAGGFLSTPVIG